ncbi:MAG TPA: hypothetical protein PL151_01285 [Phycisphaerae bacterium]|nr:hypothetical protein [Phycisphaerae bacterium]HON65673.1 hypothetical protein [Phycisphaerae bacterium]HOQ86146.1 hypothetical protein [Phycisphaerae bacterium]HPP28076.1 hypothetical protein [Phycisphaerae bacterium]HPZ96845.1 hypothetical protein [Phycisphaerae bacterium]
MITCQHARHLFDRYLDGELPSSLQAELHAHQLNCSDCQAELALAEAYGDVIAYDRCEPTLSASFTDRVLLAYRAQQVVAPRRNWSRMLISIASPLAAAASIALAVFLIAPTASERPQGLLAGQIAQVSDPTIEIVGASGKGRNEVKAARMEQMPAGFVDVILDPIVKQTRSTLDGTKRSLEQLESLIGLGFAGANDTLAAGWRDLQSDRKSPSGSSSPKISGPDLFAPSLPQEAAIDSDLPFDEFDDTIEAL